MPMNPRLLRPRASSGYGLDARDWQTRVIANGGTVSASTMKAVDTFCKSIVTAGLRDRFYRLNLFAGTGLSAALVPLFRGPSLGGTQFGSATDTNVGPFVSGDYVETGSSAGLKADATTKYLRTGFTGSMFPSLTNRHISVYERVRSTAAGGASIGGGDTATGSFFVLRPSSTTNMTVDFNGSVPAAHISSSYTTGAFWIGQNTSLRDATLYRNGSGSAGTLSFDVVAHDREMQVFAISFGASNGVVKSDCRLSGYSIGAAFSDSQATAYNTAMQAFQTAMSRNV